MGSPRGSRAGTMFGPYELRSLIGRGGMGEVYEAYDTVKDRVVALKLLRAELSADPGFRERFRRESRVAARLAEPHVIPVHDFGDINGALYIDMRLVAGTNLGALVRDKGPFDPMRAASVIGQVAAALDAAHAAGLVHRDVKPENVLLTPTDFAYLVDFGIAHFGGETSLTSAGAAIGSGAYMAPERFTGGAVGPPADIYALACLLYECLTGVPPFPPGDLVQMMGLHVMRPPPRPSLARPGLNPAIDDVIARGMAKQPAARFPSAGELARAAGVAVREPPTMVAPRGYPHYGASVPPGGLAPGGLPLGGSPPGGLPQSSPPRRGFALWPLVAAGAVVLAAAIVAVGLLVFGPGRRGEVASTPSASAPGVTATSPSSGPGSATTRPPSPTPATSTISLPDATGQGFRDYPGARCDAGTTPAVMARTSQSVLVVCRTGPGNYYYRGVRLSDSAGIELANAVRSSGGYDVTNPTDGTRYEIRPTTLTILAPGGQVYVEPMVEYAAS